MKARQAEQRAALKQKQILEKRELERQDRALRKLENKERRSLKTELIREQRGRERGGREAMPRVVRDPARKPHEKGALTIKMNTVSGIRTKLREQGELSEEFARHADGLERADQGEEGRTPKTSRRRSHRRHRPRRPRGKDHDRDR